MFTKLHFTKARVTLFLVLFFSMQSIGQQSYDDFQKEEDITKKAEIGYFLWNEYLRNDLDSLKIMSVELLLSAAEHNSAYARAIGSSSLGSYLIRSGDVEVGIRHLKDGENYYEQKEDYTLLSEAYNEIGNGYYLAGKYNEAIKSYLSSLRYGGLSPDVTAAFNGKLGLGRAYCAVGDTSVGLYTVEKYKDESIEHLKFEAAADAYAYMAMVEMDRGNMEVSRDYYEKSILFSGKSSSKSHLSHAYNNKAILHFNLGEKDSSLMYFEKALKLRERINHHKGIVESFYNLGFFYLDEGDFHNAYIYFNKSARIAKEKAFKGDEKDALAELMGICEELGYLEEVNRVEKRIAALEAFMEEKKSADKEIVAYAQQVIEDAKIVDDVKVSEEKSNWYLWAAGGLVILLLIGMLRKKRR